jgi:hypothetical protein
MANEINTEEQVNFNMADQLKEGYQPNTEKKDYGYQPDEIEKGYQPTSSPTTTPGTPPSGGSNVVQPKKT